MSAAKGFIYAELEITDQDHFYDEYMPRVHPVLQKYGARFLIAGGNPEVIEGGRTVRRVVFIEFDSLARAKEFYWSKDYQDVIDYRFKSAKTHLYIMEGTPPGQPAEKAAGAQRDHA